MASKNNITGSSVVPMNAKLRKKKMKKITKPLFQYSPSKMKEALVTILVHKMKMKAACKLYNVPRSTICHKLDGSAPAESYSGVFAGGHLESEIMEWGIGPRCKRCLDFKKGSNQFHKYDSERTKTAYSIYWWCSWREVVLFIHEKASDHLIEENGISFTVQSCCEWGVNSYVV